MLSACCCVVFCRTLPKFIGLAVLICGTASGSTVPVTIRVSPPIACEKPDGLASVPAKVMVSEATPIVLVERTTSKPVLPPASSLLNPPRP